MKVDYKVQQFPDRKDYKVLKVWSCCEEMKQLVDNGRCRPARHYAGGGIFEFRMALIFLHLYHGEEEVYEYAINLCPFCGQKVVMECKGTVQMAQKETAKMVKETVWEELPDETEEGKLARGIERAISGKEDTNDPRSNG